MSTILELCDVNKTFGGGSEAVHALDKRVARVESMLAKKEKKKKKKKDGASNGPPRTKLPPSARREAGNG